MTNQKRFAFSGCMASGKDWLSAQANLEIRGFADPIYLLCKWLTGTSDKSVPGVRTMLQRIGQWGRGYVSEEYPMSVERSYIVEKIRGLENEKSIFAFLDGFKQQNENITHAVPGFEWVDWSQYGTHENFWVNILIENLDREHADPAKSGISVVNVRFSNELLALKGAGFEHFHVKTDQFTRRLRMLDKGYPVIESEQNDHSEAMAQDLDGTMEESKVIWNDTKLMPIGKKYLTVPEFLDRVAQTR